METNNNGMFEQSNNENFGNTSNVITENIENELSINNETKGRKKKSKVLITLLVAVVVLFSTGVLAILMINSDEVKFFNLLVKKQPAVEFINQMNDDIKNSEQINTSFAIDIGDIAKTFGLDFGTDFKIDLNLENVERNQDSHGSLEVELNDKSLGFIEYAKTGEIYGAKIDETTDKFIAIENKDLQDVFDKFEVEDAESMPDRILTQEDFEKVIKLTESDREDILDKYLKTMAKSVDGSVIVEKDVVVKFGDKELTTKKYTLGLTERNTCDIQIAVLEELKNDRKNIELVLNDIKAVLKLMEENGYQVKEIYGVSSEELPTVDEVINKIEEYYNESIKINVEELNAEEIEIEISVYEYKGETVVTEVATDGEVMKFKSLIDEEIYMSFGIEEDNEEIAAIVIRGNRIENQLEIDMLIEVSSIELKLLTIKYEYLEKAERDFVELNSETAIILNNVTKEEINEFGEELATSLQKFVEEKTEELKEVLPIDEFMNSQTAPDYSYEDENY